MITLGWLSALVGTVVFGAGIGVSVTGRGRDVMRGHWWGIAMIAALGVALAGSFIGFGTAHNTAQNHHTSRMVEEAVEGANVTGIVFVDGTLVYETHDGRICQAPIVEARGRGYLLDSHADCQAAAQNKTAKSIRAKQR